MNSSHLQKQQSQAEPAHVSSITKSRKLISYLCKTCSFSTSDLEDLQKHIRNTQEAMTNGTDLHGENDVNEEPASEENIKSDPIRKL